MRRLPADSWLAKAACVDLRSESAYATDRPRGAVRLEVDDLLLRPYLLPPRSHPLVLVGGPRERLKLAVTALRAAGHAEVRHLPEDGWRALLEVETGPPSRSRLWEPSPLLAEALASAPPPHGATAIDIACGSGRNAVYLALQGCNVTGIDILPDALDRARDLAVRCGTSLRTEQVDLEFPGALDDKTADVVVVVRYLERTLFRPLLRMLQPGGLLVYETFTIDQQELGHPRNPRFLLQRGELFEAFRELDVLRYEEGFFDGAHLARLVARRNADGDA